MTDTMSETSGELYYMSVTGKIAALFHRESTKLQHVYVY